jgi:hypothetical protein
MPRSTKTITERQLNVRAQLWPDLRDEDLWNHTKSKGFTNVPRAMPFILLIMDSLAPKHHPVSSVYLDLWCRQFDEKFVGLKNPREMAFASGFNGQRAERTWLDRIKTLATLGFISVKPGPQGPYSYALILNPFKVILRVREKAPEAVSEALFNTLLSRVAEVGALDLTPTAVENLAAVLKKVSGFQPVGV